MPFGAELAMASAGQAIGNLINEAMGIAFQPIKNKQQLKQAQKLQWMQEEGAVRLGDYNYGKQLEMWKATNAPAQMALLKEAGLNPALMYGGKGAGGATTGSGGGTVSGQSAETASPARGAEGMGIQIALMDAQRKNIEADTELKLVDAKKKAGVDTELGQATIEELKQRVATSKAQEALTWVDQELRQVQASVARQTIKEQMENMENIVKEGKERIEQLQLANKLTKAQFDDAIQLLKNQVATEAIKASLMKAQKENTEQDTKNKIQEVLESEARISAMKSQLMLAWDKFEDDKTNTLINWMNYLDGNDWDFIKDFIPSTLIPIGKGFGGGHKPVKGFGR